MTGLSVVVVSAGPGRATALRALGALKADLTEDDEIVWVDAIGPPPSDGTVTVRLAPTPVSRGMQYALGLQAACRPYVAFTDTASVVHAGWRDAAAGALAEGAGVVGGPVLPSPDAGLRSLAGFFAEYGAHAVSPYRSAGGDVAANNVAYARTALRSVLDDGEPVWKSQVNARLAADGIAPRVATAMRVTSLKCYSWREVTLRRVAHGRLYGAQRSVGWGLSSRLLAAVACSGLPLIAYGRLARAVGSDGGLRPRFVRATPVVVAALAAWSAGEAWGYLAGQLHDDECAVF